MTRETYVVAFEGGETRSGVLDYAIAQAGKAGAALHLLHVLEWSPYSFLTPQELEERHARRQKELTRARSAILEPALASAREAGVEAEGEIRYGSIVDIIVERTRVLGATMIFVGRAGGNAFGARLFGSVPLGLAQIAPVPTVIVP